MVEGDGTSDRKGWSRESHSEWVLVISGKNRFDDRGTNNGSSTAYVDMKNKLHKNNGYVKRKESVGDTDVYVIVVNEAHLSYAVSNIVHDGAFKNYAVSAGPGGTSSNASTGALEEQGQGRNDFYQKKRPKKRRSGRFESAANDRFYCRTEPSGLDGGYRTGYFSWALDRIDSRENALDGEACFFGSPDKVYSNEEIVDVYVLDTGIQNHPSFARDVSYDYSYYDANGVHSFDCNGHGTHVGGLIASSVYGVSPWNVQLHSVKVLDCEGDGDFASMLSGLTWVSNNLSPTRRSVINLSLGSDGGFSSSVSDLIETLAEDKGVFIVASMGNYGKDDCEVFPANVPSVIAVGATDENDERAEFSNYGNCLTVFAPGTNIISCSNKSPSAGVRMSGTSMSAPVVSGALANWMHELYPPSFKRTSMASMKKTFFSKFSSNRVNFDGLEGYGGRVDTPNEMIYVGDALDSNLPPPPPRYSDGDPSHPRYGDGGRVGGSPTFYSSSTRLSVNVLKAMVALFGIYVVTRETSSGEEYGWKFGKKTKDRGSGKEDREDLPTREKNINSRATMRDVGWYVGMIVIWSMGIKMHVDKDAVPTIHEESVTEATEPGVNFVAKVVAMGQLLYESAN